MDQTTEKQADMDPRTERAVKALQSAILSKRLTLEAVGARVARDKRTISEWVSGLRPPPATVLAALEEILGL